MNTPTPASAETKEKTNLSPQPTAKPTALEALQSYFARWGKIDASLNQRPGASSELL